MLRSILYFSLAATVLAVPLAGCGDRMGGDDPPVGAAGAALSVDYLGGADVIGFRLFVERVPCSPGDAVMPYTAHFDIPLLDGLMPGMVELLERRLDPTSRHVGADFFVALEPGCYDIVAAPAAAFDGDDFTPSLDCAAAHARGVEVVAGMTVEPEPLISQCVGAPDGHPDIPIVINHPPHLAVRIDEKFAYECESVTICAYMYDIDDDPVEVDFTLIAEAERVHAVEIGPLELIGFEEGHRLWRQCAAITVRVTGSYSVEVVAYDLAWRDGQQVRFEALLEPPLQSRDTQTVPVHVNWVEEPLCHNGDGALVPASGVRIERAEGCDYIDAEEYYCHMGREDIRAFVCPDGELDPTRLYPPCAGCQSATEQDCDGLDDDCDGRIDEGVQNACGACGPVPDEVCNGADDDCDGTTDEGVQNACGDCGPVPAEACNGIDDDCDGSTDEGVQNACGGCGPVPAERDNDRDDDCDGDIDEGICVRMNEAFLHGWGHCNVRSGRDDDYDDCMDERGDCGADEHRAWCRRRMDDSWNDFLLDRARERYPECRRWALARDAQGQKWWVCRDFVDGICDDSDLRYETPLMLLFGDDMLTGPRFIPAPSHAHPLDLSRAQDGSGVTDTWAIGDWLLMPPPPGVKVSGRDLLGNATLDAAGKPRFVTGFEALAALYDRDGSGFVTADELSGADGGRPLVVWRDDGDRRVAADELIPLTELGVLAIRAVPRDEKPRFVTRGPGVGGFVRGIAEAYLVRGEAIERALVVDVFVR